MSIIRELGYRKFWARQASKMLTVEHKTTQGNICAEHLQHSEKDGDAFLKNNYSR
jgi:hypothetical protein